MSRIIFINRYFYPDHSATSQLLTDLAFNLAATGKDVAVITSRQTYDDPKASLQPHEIVNGVKVFRVSTSRFGRKRLLGRAIDYISFYASAGKKLADVSTRNDIVIAKTDPPLISLVAYIVARIRGLVLVNWIQDLFPEVARELGVNAIKLVAPILKRLRNVSLQAARVNVVLGQQMANRLKEEGVPGEKIRIIPNWADGTAINPVPPKDNPLRRDWGLDNKFVVGYSGNMGRAHEFSTILRVIEQLRDDEAIHFLFVGSGAQRGWLMEQADVRQLPNISFRPYQERNILHYSLSVPDLHFISLKGDLEGLIVPSKFYGILAAGRPVLFIGAPDGELAQAIKESSCGLAVATGDAESAAQFIRLLATDHERTKLLREKARQLFDEHYDIVKALGSWKSLLSEIA